MQGLSLQIFKGGEHSYFSDKYLNKQDYEAFSNFNKIILKHLKTNFVDFYFSIASVVFLASIFGH